MPGVVDCIVTITKVDMDTFHIHGSAQGGVFMFRPMERSIMDKALCFLGRTCKLKVQNAIIIDVEEE